MGQKVKKNCWAKLGSIVTNSEIRHRPGVGRWGWGAATNLVWIGGNSHGRGLKGTGCRPQRATSSLEVVVGRVVILFPPTSISGGKCEELEK